MGSKNSELWSWEVEDIRKMTGPLAVQEYIQELIRTPPLTQATTRPESIASSRSQPQWMSTAGSTSM